MSAEDTPVTQRVAEPFTVDGPTHPKFFESSWPLIGPGRGPTNHSFPHVAPEFVLVAPIGNMWVPHAWHRLQDMVSHAEKESGLTIALHEIPDWCLMPFDSIGQMRIGATLLAVDAGIQWLLLLENDVLVEPDTLERLLAWETPIVAPLLMTPDGGMLKPTAHLKQGTGLKAVRTTVFSILLFDVKVFNAIGPESWGQGTGLGEGPFWQLCNHYGHRIYIDTNTVVQVARGPSYPGNLGWDEYWVDRRRLFDEARLLERDRRPPPGYDPVWTNDPVSPDGAYMPMRARPLRARAETP